MVRAIPGGISDNGRRSSDDENNAVTQPIYLIFLGAPGAGKGTQATLLERRFGLPHVASGDLFRDNVKRQTALGIKVQSYLDRGDMVPDDVTIAMVMERLIRHDCSNGAVLDGFPRTVAQAEALDRTMVTYHRQIKAAINLRVKRETLMARLTGRWICRDCQAIYHLLNNPPKVKGKCDVCNGELYQRSDDQPATVVHRLEVCFIQTAPLFNYYNKQGLLHNIEGERDIESVHRSILTVLNGARP
jgi:adenylate kinase